MPTSRVPHQQGLYHPHQEHDACGVGAVVHIKGQASHQILSDSLQVLVNLAHRGAVGAEHNTGDGAGVLLQLPHKFLARVAGEAGFGLPAAGDYGVGFGYMPTDPAVCARCQEGLAQIAAAEGLEVLGWREVPTDNSDLGATARGCEPRMLQVFVGRGDVESGDAFERKLYVLRRLAEAQLSSDEGKVYFASMSSRTIVYKGMLIGTQLAAYYPDLQAEDMETAISLVHSRFSTNTFPSWERAHPYRYIIHNGEINTLRGNINWMRARQANFVSELFGDDLAKVLPVIDEDGSDSAMADNCLEFLHLAGREMAHAAVMMVPEPWQKDYLMDPVKKAFYEYHSSLMEPWDGPAFIGFTNGIQVGALLDRNGLRPARYVVTRDERIIMASEVGVLDIAPEDVVEKGRVRPGRMFLVDTAEGRIIGDAELKEKLASANPYQEWLDSAVVRLDTLEAAPAPAAEATPLLQRQQAFGYSQEDLTVLMAPMARDAVEPLGSMGTDTPLAVLSEKQHLLYDYFKQLFAQVTNPPIDATREELVTATETLLGAEANLLSPGPESCRQVALPSPILTTAEMAKIRALDLPGLKARTLSTLFDPTGDGEALESAMTALCEAASAAVAEGCSILVLSDRGVGEGLAPIPALLAVAGVHHHLVEEGTRTRASLVVESGEPREVHHFALLIGYGAGAINPYLALETVDDLVAQGLLKVKEPAKVVPNYIKSLVKGIVKTMSKMGICTVQSYRGAQIFEAVGLKKALVDRYFTGTPSRLEGLGIEEISQEAAARHRRAFEAPGVQARVLDAGTQYRWRAEGDDHLYEPETIHLLQMAARTGDYEMYKRYAERLTGSDRALRTLRALLDFAPGEAVPLDEVESVESICRRFKTGAMSYGSISKEAHEALAIAMNRIGGKSNTGEGGEDPARFIKDENGDSRCSAIKQVASARFGVTSEYLVNSIELQIKMAQGAKPGEGGQLPGSKVYPWIARVRHSTPGVGLISPPPHHDIYSIEDLAELIHDLKNANRYARISVKLVSEVGVGTIAAGVAKAHADVILISGYDGGTGASPQSSIKHAGLPWELGLAETHQTLLLNNLRSRVILETDGKLMTGRDVVVAALLGAEEFGFATAPLVVLGCVMMRVCQLDTCPTGVATQNPELRKRFAGSPDYVVNFMRFIAQDVREHMARLGFRTLDEMVGRVDRLNAREAEGHWKARGLDLSAILARPEVGPEVDGRCTMGQDHGLEGALDLTALEALCAPALERGEPVRATLPIRNVHRVVGTITGSELTRRHGAAGLPEDTIHLKFVGSAGQSFGAFIPRGMTLELEGDANDYIGKGISGGRVIVYPPEGSTFAPEDNVVIGNVAFYGATSGEAFINGAAGERFMVRNGGASAVVESVGDHGCEYMTGGRVVVLGRTGWNFAAGMSGGIAYVFDPEGIFPGRCNQGMVKLMEVEDEAEGRWLRDMVLRHVEYTGSPLGQRVLADWEANLPRFVKVYPTDYRRMLEAMARVEAEGLTGDEAVLAAFEANKSDRSRVGGN